MSTGGSEGGSDGGGGGSGGAAERLFALAKAREERRKAMIDSEAAELTFKPKITPRSRRIRNRAGEDGAAPGSGGSVGARLFEDAKRQRAKREQAIKEEDKKCTFRPTMLT